jgi:hypothetical protein
LEFILSDQWFIVFTSRKFRLEAGNVSIEQTFSFTGHDNVESVERGIPVLLIGWITDLLKALEEAPVSIETTIDANHEGSRQAWVKITVEVPDYEKPNQITRFQILKFTGGVSSP